MSKAKEIFEELALQRHTPGAGAASLHDQAFRHWMESDQVMQYLLLYRGRRDPDADMKDLYGDKEGGFEGPAFPLSYAIWEDGGLCVGLHTGSGRRDYIALGINRRRQQKAEMQLPVPGPGWNLVLYDQAYYGAWAIKCCRGGELEAAGIEVQYFVPGYLGLAPTQEQRRAERYRNHWYYPQVPIEMVAYCVAHGLNPEKLDSIHEEGIHTKQVMTEWIAPNIATRYGQLYPDMILPAGGYRDDNHYRNWVLKTYLRKGGRDG